MANVTRLVELGMVPELAKEVAAQIDAVTTAYTAAVAALTAADIAFTPAGGIAATDVQAAIVELDTEKAAA